MWPLLLLLLCNPGNPDTSNAIMAPLAPDRGHHAPVMHIRPLSRAADQLLTEGIERSPVIYDLVEKLQASDEVIYLSYTGLREIPRARTQLMSSAPGVRFLKIDINVTVAPFERLPLLAHELQHAVEIAAATDVRDEEGLRQLYKRIGLSGEPGRYETAAARQVELRVRNEHPRNRQ